MIRTKTKGSSSGCLTQIVVYAIMVTAMYFAGGFSGTQEVTANFTESQERDFHIAAVRLKKEADDTGYVAFSLAQLKAGKVDLASVSFLLPEDAIRPNVPGADVHKVTVLERHPDWQLVEYHYGNTHDSISRYRAFKDRIEPVSYRVGMSIAIFFTAMVLVIPAWIVAFLVNVIWKAISRRKKSSDAP